MFCIKFAPLLWLDTRVVFSKGHFKAFWAPAGLPRPDLGRSEQYNDCRQAPAGSWGPNFACSMALRRLNFDPAAQVPSCSGARDT